MEGFKLTTLGKRDDVTEEEKRKWGGNSRMWGKRSDDEDIERENGVRVGSGANVRAIRNGLTT